MKYRINAGNLNELEKVYNNKNFYLPFRNQGDFLQTKRDLTSYGKKYYISFLENSDSYERLAYYVSRERNSGIVTIYENNVCIENYNENALLNLLTFELNRTLKDGFYSTIVDIPIKSFVDLYHLSLFDSEIVGFNFSNFVNVYQNFIATFTVKITHFNYLENRSLVPFKKVKMSFGIKKGGINTLSLIKNALVNCGCFYIFNKTVTYNIDNIILVASQLCNFTKKHSIILGILSKDLLIIDLCLKDKMHCIGYLSNFLDGKSYVVLTYL